MLRNQTTPQIKRAALMPQHGEFLAFIIARILADELRGMVLRLSGYVARKVKIRPEYTVCDLAPAINIRYISDNQKPC
jgi:hypothetical protein